MNIPRFLEFHNDYVSPSWLSYSNMDDISNGKSEMKVF